MHLPLLPTARDASRRHRNQATVQEPATLGNHEGNTPEVQGASISSGYVLPARNTRRYRGGRVLEPTNPWE